MNPNADTLAFFCAAAATFYFVAAILLAAVALFVKTDVVVMVYDGE